MAGGELEEVHLERFATGGEAVGRLGDGRVVFVRDGLPGETALVRIEHRKKKWARGVAVTITEPSPDRRPLTCGHAVSGSCGGCDWLHLDRAAQRRHKVEIVAEQLQRLGAITEPAVHHRPDPAGPRTSVRCTVTEGRAGFRARRSNDAFVAASCQATDPALEELVVDGRFGDATEVVLRVGALTGERLAMADTDPATISVPSDVVVCSTSNPQDAHLHEVVADHRFRISAGSFFQSTQIGAESLVAAVREALAPSSGAVADLYAGVGLLGVAAAADRLVVAVESSASSVADARHNVSADVEVVQSPVERWSPRDVGAVIADPARVGLGQAGVDVIAATGAQTVVLVSCDPAALGRDAALLGVAGYGFEGAEVVDMFTDTSRIEAVSRFTRS